MKYSEKMYQEAKRLYFAGCNEYGWQASYDGIGWTVLVFRSRRERDNYVTGGHLRNHHAEPLTRQQAIRAAHGKYIYGESFAGYPYHTLINGCIGELRNEMAIGNAIAKL